VVAPFELHDRMLALIRRETDNARRGLPARIVAKMNSLVDRQIIDALYEASQAGVRIDLVVRGICCLRAGQPGLSETITVRSIVGRFLEHSRIFAFHTACRPEVWLSSADWMPRNFFKRIEVAFPIEDGNLRDRVLWELDSVVLADTVKARALFPDGSYQRVRASGGAKPLDSQADLIRRAREGTASDSGRREFASSYPKVRLAQRPKGRAGS